MTTKTPGSNHPPPRFCLEHPLYCAAHLDLGRHSPPYGRPVATMVLYSGLRWRPARGTEEHDEQR